MQTAGVELVITHSLNIAEVDHAAVDKSHFRAPGNRPAHLLQGSWVQQVVRVQKHDQVRTGPCRSQIAGRRRTAVFAIQNPDPIVITELGQTLQTLRVMGPVIHQDDLEVRGCLRFQRGERVLQEVGPVVERNDDRHHRAPGALGGCDRLRRVQRAIDGEDLAVEKPLPLVCCVRHGDAMPPVLEHGGRHA